MNKSTIMLIIASVVLQLVETIISKMTDWKNKVTLYIKAAPPQEIKTGNFKIKEEITEPPLKSWQGDKFAFLFDFFR